MQDGTGFGKIERKRNIEGKIVAVVSSLEDQLCEKCPVWHILDPVLSKKRIAAAHGNDMGISQDGDFGGDSSAEDGESEEGPRQPLSQKTSCRRDWTTQSLIPAVQLAATKSKNVQSTLAGQHEHQPTSPLLSSTSTGNKTIFPGRIKGQGGNNETDDDMNDENNCSDEKSQEDRMESKSRKRRRSNDRQNINNDGGNVSDGTKQKPKKRALSTRSELRDSKWTESMSHDKYTKEIKY